MVCMPCSRGYRSIALVIGTILRTIDCVYLQLPGGNAPLTVLQHGNANNDVFSILWHQLRVLFPPLGMLGAGLDGYIVRATWELRGVLRDARGLSGESGVRCKGNTRRHKLSSLRVIYSVSRLLIHEMRGGCTRWRLGRFVFVKQHNAGYESKLSYLTSWTKKWQELEYIYPFFLSTPPFSFPAIINTLPGSWPISTSRVLHNTTPLVPTHTC